LSSQISAQSDDEGDDIDDVDVGKEESEGEGNSVYEGPLRFSQERLLSIRCLSSTRRAAAVVGEELGAAVRTLGCCPFGDRQTLGGLLGMNHSEDLQSVWVLIAVADEDWQASFIRNPKVEDVMHNPAITASDTDEVSAEAVWIRNDLPILVAKLCREDDLIAQVIEMMVMACGD
jgi:hypothetical protein